MADSFEPYHIPQQSRRDKLRVITQTHLGSLENFQSCTGLVPLYDPSVIPSDWITSYTTNLHPQNYSTQASSSGGCIKHEGVGVNLMGYGGSGVNMNLITTTSSSSTSNELYMYPQSNIQLNPSSIQDIKVNPFIYTPQNLRVLDHQSFHGGGGGGEVMVYKSEPFSMAHETNNRTGQGLSLSLSSDKYTPPRDLPLSPNQQRVRDGCVNPFIVGGVATVPLGPFTGYASILKGSRFLKPAQQLLEEYCEVGRGVYAEKISVDSALVDPPLESLSGSSGIVDDDGGDSGEQRRKKSRLISMLDEVYRRYKQYYQQMQAVVESFEAVAGLSNAAPFANLALKTMLKHFRCLKNAITDQLRFMTKSHGHINYGNDETPRFGNADRGLFGQRPVSSGFIEHQPMWRPQRGLPERAVTVLRAWLFEHFLHPYPTDTDKLMLAKRTGLSRNQVSNWFINARVRIWKPMVEEIHTLETRQAQKVPQMEEQNVERPLDHLPATNSLASENPSTRARNEFPNVTVASEEPMNLSYGNLPHHEHAGVGMSTSGGISLTLGLHQDNGVALSESFPMNAARRFGLDANSDAAYIMGGFEARNREFGRDVIGGQLFHDFVE